MTVTTTPQTATTPANDLESLSIGELAEHYCRRVFIELLTQPDSTTLIAAPQKLPRLHPAARIVINTMMKAINLWRKPSAAAATVEVAQADVMPSAPAEPAPMTASAKSVPSRPVAEAGTGNPSLWEPSLAWSLSPSPSYPVRPATSADSPLPPWLLSGKPAKKSVDRKSKR